MKFDLGQATPVVVVRGTQMSREWPTYSTFAAKSSIPSVVFTGYYVNQFIHGPQIVLSYLSNIILSGVICPIYIVFLVPTLS